MDHYELHADEIVGVVQRNNPRSSTEIIGDIRSRPDLQEESKHSNIVALCTLGGMFIETCSVKPAICGHSEIWNLYNKGSELWSH